MYLSSLHLFNFRNLGSYALDLKNVNLILGSNAQGKTNLLESIYYLATSRSIRAEKDFQIIQQGESVCRVGGSVLTDSGSENIKLEIAMQLVPQNPEVVEKRLKVNDLPKRMMDYIGNLIVVYFSPEDINLVTGSPSLRRLYLDLTLSQIDKEYKRALSSYNSVLVSRNRLLKRVREGSARLNELEFWDMQLVKHGEIISQKRFSYFDFINNAGISLNRTVGSFGEMGFEYFQNIISSVRLENYQTKEVEAAATLIGPHRDDFAFLLNKQNLAFFGSRGQQRMAVLDLKLSEIKFIHETKNITPVLLLDDIFSELDEERRAYVISVISGFQTILTAIETENIPQKFLENVNALRMEKGNVTQL